MRHQQNNSLHKFIYFRNNISDKITSADGLLNIMEVWTTASFYFKIFYQCANRV